MVQENSSNNAPLIEKEEPKETAAMVPLLNWRTIIVVAIGLIIGISLGFIYWIFIPSLGSSDSSADTESGSGFGQFLRGNAGPWESDVRIQIVNPGSAYVDILDLQDQGEYYAAKANSLPYYEFLSNELNKLSPEYDYTSDILDQMVLTAYEIYKESPSIEVSVTASTSEETLFLVRKIPEIFLNYLSFEEKEKRQREYQNTLKAVESTKEAILKAESELAALSFQEVNRNLLYNPTYIALNNKIISLENKLEEQADELSTIIALGELGDTDNSQQYYQRIQSDINILKANLVEKNGELAEIDQLLANNNINSNPDYIELNAKLTGLENEVDRMINGYFSRETSGTESVWIMGLAEMIANNITGETYEKLLGSLKNITGEIVKTRNEITTVETQLKDLNSALEIDRVIIQAEIVSLSDDLDTLLSNLPSTTAEHDANTVQEAFDRTSIALAEAKKEIALLESNVESETIRYEDLEYRMAQTKVDNLYTELGILNDSLNSFLVDEADEPEIENLAIGVPEMPTPVTAGSRLRDVLLIAGIIGIGGAWLILNRKWLISSLSPSSKTSKENENEE